MILFMPADVYFVYGIIPVLLITYYLLLTVYNIHINLSSIW